jgi:hypothetical protein
MPPQKIDPKDARQGRKGTPMLMVLIVALILAAIAWFGVEMFGQATAPEGTDVEMVEPPASEAEGDDSLAPATEAPAVEPQAAPAQ